MTSLSSFLATQQGKAVLLGLSTTLVQTETSQQLLDGLPRFHLSSTLDYDLIPVKLMTFPSSSPVLFSAN